MDSVSLFCDRKKNTGEEGGDITKKSTRKRIEWNAGLACCDDPPLDPTVRWWNPNAFHNKFPDKSTERENR